jgi:SEC-C motif-containing protein
VAHGAAEACKAFSDENVYGSLAIWYGPGPSESAFPFMVHLEKEDPVHLFDSDNLEIVLTHLDTITDFTAYITAKEAAIGKYEALSYCGEEDLLAHYLYNYDKKRREHVIGPRDKAKPINGVMIGEGEWKAFVESDTYARRCEADRPSYLWDEIIQRTCQNALDGTLLGHPLTEGQSALHEMAKEPRFIRRALSERIIEAIRTFPENIPGIARKLTYLPSVEPEKGYVFLQLKNPGDTDFATEWRPRRQHILEIACGAAKLSFPHLRKVVGIAIDAPKFTRQSAEDFILMDVESWTETQRKFYREQNDIWKFFETPHLRRHHDRITEFPRQQAHSRPRRIGRNEKCPCGSGVKFKKCCAHKGLRWSSTR